VQCRREHIGRQCNRHRTYRQTMQYDFSNILLLNIFFPIQRSVSLSLTYPYFPSYKTCEQRPPAQVHRTDRLMDMLPCGQPVRVGHRAWTTLRVAHISTSLYHCGFWALSRNGTENRHKPPIGGHGASSNKLLGLRRGLSPPLATGSGKVKVYRPSILMCSWDRGDNRATSSSRTR